MKKADLKVGFSCNNNCRFCVQGSKRSRFGDKDTEKVKEEMREAAQDCEGIVLTGGEVTIRPDFLELVEYADSLGFKTIQIQTNARMFAYMDFCKKTIEAGATEFSPALHGHTADLHDYLTNSKGSFKQTVQGIKNLKTLNQTIITNTVITRSNYRHLPEIAKLLVSLGVDQYQFAFVHALGSAGENFSSIVPRYPLIEPYVKKGLDVGIKANRRVMTEAIPYCFMEGYEQYVAEDVIPDTKIYDAKEVVEDFTKERQTKGKKKGPDCKKCKYYNRCEGPWREYPEHFGWSEFENQVNSFQSLYSSLIINNNLQNKEKEIRNVLDLFFNDLDSKLLKENQKFDFSFSFEDEKENKLRFSYNDYKEDRNLFLKKIKKSFSFLKGNYDLQTLDKIINFITQLKTNYQITFGAEWQEDEKARTKIYFDDLINKCTKKERRRAIQDVANIINIDYEDFQLKEADRIGLFSIDLLPNKNINLKICLFEETLNMKTLREIIPDKWNISLTDIELIFKKLSGDDSFYYLTKRLNDKGQLESVKIYQIYEIQLVDDLKNERKKILNYLKELNKDTENIDKLIGNCQNNNLFLYPVIFAADFNQKGLKKIDVYFSAS